MNIDEMPAGPEVDRLIAEKVMGWKYVGVIQRTPGQGGPIDAYDNGKDLEPIEDELSDE